MRDLRELYRAYLVPPPGGERPRKERLLAESGRPLRLLPDAPHDPGRVAGGHVWGPPEAPAVLLMHGWGSRGTAWQAYVGPLVEKGLRVVAPDAPGHGDGDPGRSNMLLFLATALAADAAEGPFVGAAGHSLGASALVVALSRGLRAGRVVLFAATARVEDFLPRWAGPAGLTEEESAGVDALWKAEFGTDYLRTADPLTLAPGLGGTPAWIVHDEGDPEAPFADGEALAAAWPGSFLRPTTGLGHARALLDRGLARETTEFLVGGEGSARRTDLVSVITDPGGVHDDG